MEYTESKLSADLSKNAVNIRTIMDSTSDLIIKYGKILGHNICIVLCEGLASTDTVADLIYRPLNNMNNGFSESDKPAPLDELMQKIQNEILLAAEQKQVEDYDALCKLIMSGFVIILVDGVAYGLAIGVQGYKSRSIEEPSTHLNLRGSREGFVEVVRTNISMIRRRIKNPALVFKMLTIGECGNTDVCLCYIKGKADEKLIADIENRLKKVDLSLILEGGYIQPFLESKTSFAFSEIGATERPDTLSAKLYEGRVGIIVDGTPFALFVPHLFVENFQTVDDYSTLPSYSTLIRVLRYIAYIIAVILPGFYVALANFNPELFPNSLLINLANAAQTTPYPLLVECLLIHIFYEIMREAGLRMPTHIGHAVSIVGGLVIGEIVVSAGLIGAPMVLVVALGAICCFVVPDLYESIIFFKFLFIFAGGLWGLYGIVLMGFIFLVKISSMSVYGIPFTTPVSPFSLKSMRDVLYRASWRKLAKKDVKISDMNGVRIKNDE